MMDVSEVSTAAEEEKEKFGSLAKSRQPAEREV